MKMHKLLVDAFPLWVLLGSLLALKYPGLFVWFHGPWIPLGLAVIMLGMGMTLTVSDFQQVLLYPGRVALGVFLQYTVMPTLGWAIGYLLDLPLPLAVGLVLVACCPGGTASNVISFLAQADVALSCAMTAVSTFLAVLATPLLTTVLVGSRVEVDTFGLFLSAVQVVILPVAAGVLLHTFLPKVTEKLIPWSPFAAVVMITLIVASIIGSSREVILKGSGRLFAAVALLHGGGFLVGYLLARILTKDERAARTISIEVGMQNSGLGVVLAQKNFSHPLIAIPSAISSLFHSLIGSALAAIWRLDAERHIPSCKKN